MLSQHKSIIGQYARHPILLASVGGALEYYDFILFAIYTNIISQVFFPKELSEFWRLMNTYLIFAIGYFIRPIGGIIMGHFGDLFGRKILFIITLVLMTLPTLSIGLLPVYSEIGYLAPLLLLMLRILQGIAVGGEIPSAHIFVFEHAKKGKKSLANSFISVGLTLGLLFGNFIAWLLNLLFTEQQLLAFAWRIPFIIGGLLGVITIYLRKNLSETPVFIAMQKKRDAETQRHEENQIQKFPPLKIIWNQHRKNLLLSMSIVPVLVIGVIVILLIPNLMRSSHFQIDENTVKYLALSATVLNIVGGLSAGYFCEKLKKGTLIMLIAPVLAGFSIMFYLSLYYLNFAWASLFYLIVSFFSGIGAIVPFIILSCFPSNVRFTGMAFSYNISYALFAGTVAPLLNYLNELTVLSGAYYIVIICTAMFIAGLLLKNHLTFDN